MTDQPATGYLPGDPRFGLSGEALANYYRTKAAQWAIYCWDKPGMADTRRALTAQTTSLGSEVAASVCARAARGWCCDRGG